MKTSNYGKLLNTTEEVRWVQAEPFGFDFIKESNGVVEIAPNGSYLEGLTLDQKYIYMYMTKSFHMPGNIAHGNFTSISPEDANVAVNLMNLIYISRLDRLGMLGETIRELIRRAVVY